MSKPVISFVTGNPNKLKEVVMILGSEFADKITTVDIDLPEYQGEMDEISRLKCEEAIKHIRGPVMIEDTSLCFEALGGMPGPYIKWFLKPLGPSGLHKMLHGFENKNATAVCSFAYHGGKPEDEVKLFKGVTKGTIVSPRGPSDFGWDSCFQPEGFDKTYAEMEKSQKNLLSHRYKAVNALREFLRSIL